MIWSPRSFSPDAHRQSSGLYCMRASLQTSLWSCAAHTYYPCVFESVQNDTCSLSSAESWIKSCQHCILGLIYLFEDTFKIDVLATKSSWSQLVWSHRSIITSDMFHSSLLWGGLVHSSHMTWGEPSSCRPTEVVFDLYSHWFISSTRRPQ